MVNIDKGVEVPKTERKSKWGETIAAMEDGDSAFFDTQKEALSLATSIRNSGAKAVTRQDGDGFRVWKQGK